LTARDLTAFGTAANCRCRNFSKLKSKCRRWSSRYILFLFTAIACSLLLCSCRILFRWFLFLEALIPYSTLLWRNYSLDHWLGINHGIFCRQYNGCYFMERLFYEFAWKWWIAVTTGFKWIFLSASRVLTKPQHWCKAEKNSNLSPALQEVSHSLDHFASL
jgi:hypothetical protein